MRTNHGQEAGSTDLRAELARLRSARRRIDERIAILEDRLFGSEPAGRIGAGRGLRKGDLADPVWCGEVAAAVRRRSDNVQRALEQAGYLVVIEARRAWCQRQDAIDYFGDYRPGRRTPSRRE